MEGFERSLAACKELYLGKVANKSLKVLRKLIFNAFYEFFEAKVL